MTKSESPPQVCLVPVRWDGADITMTIGDADDAAGFCADVTVNVKASDILDAEWLPGGASVRLLPESRYCG